MNSTYSWYGRLATLMLVPAVFAGTAYAQDISVTSVEVNQAIQTAANSIDLVSNRSTAVRARVGVAGGGSQANVTGVLRVFVNGGEITPPAGVAPINPGFTAPAAASWDRDNETHTLNFELSAPTGIPVTNDADFVVELTPVAGETDTSNNSGSANNLTVVERLSPRLYFTRINYTPAGAGAPSIGDVQAGVGDSFVRGIYPVDDSDNNLYLEGLFPTLNWNQDPNGNGLIDSMNGEHSDILDWLESCRQLIVDAEGNGDTIFLYGWVEGNPIPSNGWGQTGGRVAFGNTQHSRHQRTYAHELGHNFGLSHPDPAVVLAPDTGWDTGARLDGNPAGNNTAGRVRESTLFDIMVGGQLTNSAWIDQTTYENFLGNNVLQPDGAPGSDKFFAERIVSISGVLGRRGEELIRFNPVFRYPWRSQPSFTGQQGRYTVRVVTDQGNTFQANFTGQLGDDADTKGEDPFGFFSVRVAVPPNEEIVRVIVSDRRTERRVAEVRRNEPPRLRILSPEPGEELEGEVTVKFEVEDPDTDLDRIRVQIAYSADKGSTWVPVAVNVRGSEGFATFPTEEIVFAENGQGVIRAIAADNGLNTVFSDVAELTILGKREPRR